MSYISVLKLQKSFKFFAIKEEMLYTLKLFGIFEDEIGKETLQIELKGPVNSLTLKNLLHEKYPVFEHVKHYMLAVNEQYCDDDDQLLNPSDEIALIPPIAGG